MLHPEGILPADIASENHAIIGPETLRDLLTTRGIPLEQWGVGNAKTFEHLVREINLNECSLKIGPQGEVIRHIVVVGVDVLCEVTDKGLLRLKEVRQVFTDGRVRERPHHTTSLAEKMMPGEDPIAAAERALREELGIDELTEINYIGATEHAGRDSQSYPGLKTTIVKHEAVAVIGPEHFNPDGYIETQDDKMTYFAWERATPVGAR